MFQLLFERCADAIWLFDPEAGVFVDCNSAAVELMRAGTKEKLLGARPEDLSPGASQKAIWVVVSSSDPSPRMRRSLLEDVSPTPSAREPASVGLKHSAQNSFEDAPSKLAADWSCRPWSWLSMNSWPDHVSE